MLLNRQVAEQDGEADRGQRAASDGQAGAEPGEVAVEGRGDGLDDRLAEGEGQEDREHTAEHPGDGAEPVVHVVGVPVHLLDVRVAHVAEEGVGEAAGDVGVDQDGRHGHTEDGERLLRVHAGAHGEGRGDQRTGVSIDTGRATEGADAEDGELHGAADVETGSHVAHDEARDEAGEHGGAGAGVPVQLVHDLEAGVQGEQDNLPPSNHGFPPSNISRNNTFLRYGQPRISPRGVAPNWRPGS